MGDPPGSPRVGTPIKGSSHLPILYYALLVAAAVAAMLAVYSFIGLKCWCRLQDAMMRPRPAFPSTSRTSFRLLSRRFMAGFEYKKNGDNDNDHECAVCLSVFEEGEAIRQLPNCKHSFHVPCIDMWLYSHVDCPLCCSLVGPPVLRQCGGSEQSEHSREMFFGGQGSGTVDVSPLVL